MKKEQVLIIKVKYDDEDNYEPYKWNWSELINGDVEVLNHSSSTKSE